MNRGIDDERRVERPVRKGKWTKEENELARSIIAQFVLGRLGDVSNGTSLRLCLAEKLGCSPMRVSKKFAGKGNGKFSLARRYRSNEVAIASHVVLSTLERLEKEDKVLSAQTGGETATVMGSATRYEPGKEGSCLPDRQGKHGTGKYVLNKPAKRPRSSREVETEQEISDRELDHLDLKPRRKWVHPTTRSPDSTGRLGSTNLNPGSYPYPGERPKKACIGTVADRRLEPPAILPGHDRMDGSLLGLVTVPHIQSVPNPSEGSNHKVTGSVAAPGRVQGLPGSSRATKPLDSSSGQFVGLGHSSGDYEGSSRAPPVAESGMPRWISGSPLIDHAILSQPLVSALTQSVPLQHPWLSSVPANGSCRTPHIAGGPAQNVTDFSLSSAATIVCGQQPMMHEDTTWAGRVESNWLWDDLSPPGGTGPGCSIDNDPFTQLLVPRLIPETMDEVPGTVWESGNTHGQKNEALIGCIHGLGHILRGQSESA